MGVPFHDLLRGFLQAAQAENMEAVVWAAPRGVIGGQREIIASNYGEAPAKARARLLIQDGAIENVARAIHESRFVADGKTEVDPSMDFCVFVPCSGALVEDGEGAHVSASTTAWDKLPNEVKELHRVFAKVLLAALAREPPKPQQTSSLIV